LKQDCLTAQVLANAVQFHQPKGKFNMTVRSSILAGVAFLALGATSAGAADLYGGKGGSIKDGNYQTEIVPSRMAHWYVRGDFSFAGNHLANIYEAPSYTATQVSIDRNWAFGGGVGYYFSKSVRGDLTLEGRSSSNVNGKIFYSAPASTVDVGLRSTVGLANLYYDFDMRSHFTPYLGIGLGFANNKTSAGALSDCGCTSTIDGASKTAAAGALMAGFSAKVFDRVSFDAGYRFLYLGDAVTGTVNTVIPRPAMHLEDVSAHEFRVGLRVDIR
jgi:opacity protein-like surface antigen